MESQVPSSNVEAQMTSTSSGRNRDLTNVEATVNLFKFMIGLGIISLPAATKQVGWLPSVIGLGIIATATVWGVILALKAAQKLKDRAGGTKAASESSGLIPRTREDSFDSGCGFFDQVVGEVWGSRSQWVFAASVTLGQFSTMVIYLDVIVANMSDFLLHGTGRLLVLVVVVLLLAFLAFIPNLRGVTALSALGLSIYLFLFAGLLYELSYKVHDGSMPKDAVMVKNIQNANYGQWFGVSCFAYGVFPIASLMYEEVKEPDQFTTVVASAVAQTWIIYAAFSVIGYLCFGEETDDLIYFNFETGSVFRNGMSLALACILFFSFMVQAMPIYLCTSRVWEYSGFAKNLEGPDLPWCRWCVLLATAVVSWFVPNISVMMNSLGVVTGVLYGFIFPTATYLWLSTREDVIERFQCVAVLVIGIVGGAYSLMGL